MNTNTFEGFKYSSNNIVPNSTIDLFYDQIKMRIDEGEDYDHFIKNILKINGGVLPDKIKSLIDNQK